MTKTASVPEPILINDIMLEALALSSSVFEAKQDAAGNNSPANKKVNIDVVKNHKVLDAWVIEMNVNEIKQGTNAKNPRSKTRSG